MSLPDPSKLIPSTNLLPTLPPNSGQLLIVSEATLKGAQDTVLTLMERLCALGETLGTKSMEHDAKSSERGNAHELAMQKMANDHEVVMAQTQMSGEGVEGRVESMLRTFQEELLRDVNNVIITFREDLTELTLTVEAIQAAQGLKN